MLALSFCKHHETNFLPQKFITNANDFVSKTSVSCLFRSHQQFQPFTQGIWVKWEDDILPKMVVSKESISKFLIGNRFHVKLRILSPENSKQSLQEKSWKAEVTAEKKQTQDYNQNFVTQAQNNNILTNWLTSRILMATKKLTHEISVYSKMRLLK